MKIEQARKVYQLTRVILGSETTARYYDEIGQYVNQQAYMDRVSLLQST